MVAPGEAREVCLRGTGDSDLADPCKRKAGCKRSTGEQGRLPTRQILHVAHQRGHVIAAKRVGQDTEFGGATFDQMRRPILMPLKLGT